METLNLVEEEVLKFVSNFFEIDQSKLTETFNLLLVRLKEIEKIKIDNRAFMYLDIIAWLESRLTNCTIAEIFCKRLKSAEYSNY